MQSDIAVREGDSKITSRVVPLGNPDAIKNGEDDGYNGRRISLARDTGWTVFDDLVRQQNRQIEENIRMLCGQHNAIFHPVFGRWLDVTEWMPLEEQRWRTRSVVNRLLPWFIITHARATENTPIVTFLPGPDRVDAELSEIMDIAAKTVWWEANMEDAHDRMSAWMIAAGRGHILSRINPNKGPMRKWVGTDHVPVVDMNDQPVMGPDNEPLSQLADKVPFDKDGKPLAKWRMVAPGHGELVPTGEPHETPIGAIEPEVLSPVQVRGSWGPQPWYHKRRHIVRSFHTPEEIYESFGIEVQPNIRGGQVSDIGELERLLYGTGFYNAASGDMGAQLTATNTDGYVELTRLWEAPSPFVEGMERTGKNPGGRYLCVTPDRVLRDGPREADYPYTSPINTWEFVRIPGRPGGTTPQEALNPLQRLYNDNYGRIKDHVNLSTNPKGVIDGASGLKAGQFTNKPGENYVLARRPGVPAIEYVAPPRLGEDVYKLQAMLRDEFTEIGFLRGGQDPGNPGESGEKLKEARFNTDRFLGPTMRRSAGEYGRMFETWMALLPTIWDMETTLSYAGDDNVARTIVVYPHLFKQGKVRARPDVESMLPEGRGEKQEHVYKFYMDGLYGEPGSPQALRKFWDSIHMPHLGRLGKPGGIDGTTAEQENGQLLQGVDPNTIPVYEWYDDDAHLYIHENFMKAPEFKNLPPNIQDAFSIHRQAHKFNQQAKLLQALGQQAGIQSALNPPRPMTPGAPGASGAGGGDPADTENGATMPVQPDDRSPPSLRPPLPQPPRAAVPGGVMPTSPN